MWLPIAITYSMAHASVVLTVSCQMALEHLAFCPYGVQGTAATCFGDSATSLKPEDRTVCASHVQSPELSLESLHDVMARFSENVAKAPLF